MSFDAPVNTAPARRESWWPWIGLALAACWVVLVRVPLVLNADNHLDSDLAVDGLTLLDATRGHWRWHYPGTPYMGIAPVLLSLPQALVWGANPWTLVSGGTVAFLGLLLATFLLARASFGPAVAGWSIVPLTFASNGAVWLSGRITGGHLPAALWHAGAFALLVGCLRHGGNRRALGLGLWCGLGMSLDSMFVVTLAGLVPAALLSWIVHGGRRPGWLLAGLFLAGFAAGLAPRVVGARVDPHNAYEEQFELMTAPPVLLEHADLLARECLPRLVAGHKLPGFQADPNPAGLTAPAADRRPEETSAVARIATVVGLLAWGVSNLGLLGALIGTRDRAGRAVVLGLVLSGVATLAGFLTNRNIFNSDNYRYLVTLLVPLALGFGLAASWLSKRGSGGRLAVLGATLTLAVGFTVDLAQWYARFGWVDAAWRPVHHPIDDPVLGWFDADPDAPPTWLEGGYWDVYRVCFLTNGRVRGAPFPIYPNRFPDWRPAPGAQRLMLSRSTPEGRSFGDSALQAGGREARRARGVRLIVLP